MSIPRFQKDLRERRVRHLLYARSAWLIQKQAHITRPPRLMVFANDGRANFIRHVIDEGTGTHDAVLAEMSGKGRLDIVGRPLHGPEKWSVHIWFNEG